VDLLKDPNGVGNIVFGNENENVDGTKATNSLHKVVTLVSKREPGALVMVL